jgi:serine/threonine protein kinase
MLSLLSHKSAGLLHVDVTILQHQMIADKLYAQVVHRLTCRACLVLRAVRHRHEQHVLHRDRKSFILLLFDNWRVKISDFGVSKMLLLQNTYATSATVGSTGTAQECVKQCMLSDHSSG